MKFFTSCYRPEGPQLSPQEEITTTSSTTLFSISSPSSRCDRLTARSKSVSNTTMVATKTTNTHVSFSVSSSQRNRLPVRFKSASNTTMVAANTYVSFSVPSSRRNRLTAPRSMFRYVKHWRPILSVISEDTTDENGERGFEKVIQF